MSDIVTSQGKISVGSVGSSEVQIATEGQLAGVMFHLFGTSGQSCDVSITAIADRPDPHELSITSVNVRGFPCGLATKSDFWLDDASALNGTLSVSPQLACEGSISARCIHGGFNITIAGSVPTRDGAERLSFLNPIVIEGSLCTLF